MARNIEIKARVRDRASLERRLATLPIRQQQELQQWDSFFHVSTGRLKLRDFSDGSAELICYERDDRAEARLSTYDRVNVPDAHAMRQLLSRALGTRGNVRKHRTVLLVGRTRIHLDRVEGLGTFLEIEVVLDDTEALSEGQAEMQRLMAHLDVRPEDLIAVAYLDLMETAALNGTA